MTRAPAITSEQIEQAYWDALKTPEDCQRLISVLEALVPTLQGEDRIKLETCVSGLRTYMQLMFPVDAPMGGGRTH